MPNAAEETPMVTPVEYAERYRNVSVQAGGQTRNVRVEIYRIGKPDAEQGSLWSKLKDHFAVNKKKDPNFRLRLNVNGVEQEFASADPLLRRVVNPFWGKGSPEDCQIALEVAVLTGRTGIDRVQDYANKHIGLDCNGFVGNYIWHVHQGHAWDTWPAKDDEDKEPYPSANIASIMNWTKKAGREITAISDMHAGKMYVMALVGDDHKVVPGGPSGPSGHIVITEPGKFMERSFVHDTMGFYDLRMAKKDAYGHPAFYVVESTGPEMQVGLRDSWYAMRPLKKANGDEVPAVFSVFRGVKGKAMKVRIAELP
jgi:hypothetical protein